MTRRSRRLVMLCGLLPALASAGLSLWRPGMLQNLERAAYDVLLRAAPARPPDSRILIVDVDERSLASFGQWPWRRDRIAELIDRLRSLGAAVVALDIIFAEPDRDAAAGANPDLALAAALRGGRVVLGYGLTFDEAAPSSPACAAHARGIPVVRPGAASDSEPLFRATGAICNLDELARAADASGFLNAAPDSDGILRRIPLLADAQGRVYPSLALASVSALTGRTQIALHVEHENASRIAVGSARVPVDGRGNLLLRYRGPKRTFPYLSAADVLRGTVPREMVDGRLVLVGTTALGTREVVSTPLDTLFTGVEVQATAADNLLQEDFVHRPRHAGTLEIGLILGLGAIAILLTGRFGIAAGGLGAAGGLACLWGLSYWALAADGLVVSPLYPTMALTGAFAAMTLTGLGAERRRADRAGEERATSQRLMIQTLLSLTEIRDAETGLHSRRTQQYARLLAGELASHAEFRQYLTAERIDLLATLAPLHDIGKVGVPDQLLRKPGALTPEELAEIRKHPVYGRDVIVNAQRHAGVRHDATLALAKEIVYTHHEKWDGTGYPEALRGADIPVPGRLMAVVDVYDALRSLRPYSRPLSHQAAVEHIVRGRGTHFDPCVVDAFVRVADRFERLSEA